MAEVVFSDIDRYDGYLIEISLPAAFANAISRSLAESTKNLKSKLGQNNVYIKLGESQTFDILEDLDLNPLEPELPALLLLDKHPEELKDTDEVILVKLGALEKSKEVPLVLDEICQLMNEKDFLSNFSLDQKIRKLKESFEDYTNVGVSLASVKFG
ncbi:hypothetical protein AKJ66_04555 [candidate division MSBL1 archaeon SCGC-AAA259E22]|uniref:Uncharacterized protein n=3 Tax=candidate division MSBL1 TaxID=215777 RepID=A0A133ULR0_9EURY|nr:hypothetical protein AKJ66_04555 [candidate division MSBL1 archaeon SCGC-AAA259E22]KXA95121.1 hypothetical protein AKJ36_01455 [candidate division MSBL1 archaeon SCGC-AAA259I07]